MEWSLSSVRSFLISIDPSCRGLCCGLGTVLSLWPLINDTGVSNSSAFLAQATLGPGPLIAAVDVVVGVQF